MVLAIDMGNTNIVVGCIEKGKILFVERLCTDLSKTELEYAIGIKTVLELYDIKDNEIDGAIIASVVPPLTTILQTAVNKIIGKVPMVVGPGIKTGLNILMDNPKAMGADLIVDSVAGINEYGAPLIIIDMGTATTVSVIDKDKNYIGIAYGGKAVCNGKHGSSAGKLFERLLNDFLALVIKRGGCLVQNKHRWIF